MFSHDGSAHLNHAFGNDRIHFPGHNGASRLQRRQFDFGQTAARTGSQQAQIVGDFHQRNGDSVQNTRQSDNRIACGNRFKIVGSRFERQSRPFGKEAGRSLRHARIAVHPGSDGRSAECQFGHAGQNRFQRFDAFGCLAGKRGELLPECHRHGILQMSASDFVHIGKLFRFGTEGRRKGLKGIDEFERFAGGGNVHGRRNNVVRRLSAVDGVVRVHRRFGPFPGTEHFVGPVGDDFVHIHIPAGSGTGLVDIERKIPVEFSVNNFVAGSGNGSDRLRRQDSQFSVDKSRRFFDLRYRFQKRLRNAPVGNFEIFQSTCRLGAVIFFGRDVHDAHGIFFFSHFIHVYHYMDFDEKIHRF